MSIRSSCSPAGSTRSTDDTETYAARPVSDAPRFDLLTDVIEQVHLEGTVMFDAALPVPYGIDIDRPGRAPFYIGVEAEGGVMACEIEVRSRTGKGAKLYKLHEGDIVMLPGGARHIVRSGPGAHVVPFAQWMKDHPKDAAGRLHRKGDGAYRRVIGGFFSTESMQHNPLFAALPPIILLRGDEPAVQRWLRPTVDFIRAEIETSQQGSTTVLRRMADVLFIQVLRAFAAQNDITCGWLRGLADPRVGRALLLLHQRYREDWTLEQLAHEVGASRTLLAVRFKELVGEAPMAYLTRWRVTRAANQLRTEKTPLSRVAENVGYQSDAVFSKAFRRVTGQSPGSYRREAVAN
jgi:AraC-like DNA-binding protein